MKADEKTEALLDGMKRCVSAMRTAVRLPGREEAVRLSASVVAPVTKACAALEIPTLVIRGGDTPGAPTVRFLRPKPATEAKDEGRQKAEGTRQE